jgi:hypothetical protein
MNKDNGFNKFWNGLSKGFKAENDLHNEEAKREWTAIARPMTAKEIKAAEKAGYLVW